MCINLYTSTIAYLIGTISGLFLIKNKNKEKKMIGYFILFYTLVQLFEALIYKDNKTIYSRILLINLGLQGIVFALLLNNYISINNIYIYIFSIIAIFIIYESIQSNFIKATTENGMIWNFSDKKVSIILLIMYILMFFVMYYYKNKLNYMNKFTVVLLLTFIISYSINILYPKSLCSINKASIWCLSSAIVAPIMLII